MTFDESSEGSKVTVWKPDYADPYNKKKFERITLPKTFDTPHEGGQNPWFYVEGISQSISQGDVEFSLTYTKDGFTFEDKIKVTVIELDKICLSSGNAIESPVCFEGGVFELGNPCTTTDAEDSLIIPNCNVRSLIDPSVIRDFVVGAEAFFVPDLDLLDLPAALEQADKWWKVAGPASGYFDDIKMLHAKYKNPKKGGVYELAFELPYYDSTRTKSLLHLPLAGPDATDWTLGEKSAVLAFGDRIILLEAEIAGIRVPVFRDGITFAFASAGFDWYYEANQSGRSPCHVWGENETLTISSVVVDRAKFQDMMWAILARKVYGPDYWLAVRVAIALSHGGIVSPDTDSTKEAYRAGKDLADGVSIASVMENRGYEMQEPGGLSEKLWPSEYPYVGGIERNPFMDMTNSELIDLMETAIREQVEDIWPSLF